MGKLVVGYIRIISWQLNDLGVLKSLAEDERKHGRLNYACLDNPNSHSYWGFLRTSRKTIFSIKCSASFPRGILMSRQPIASKFSYRIIDRDNDVWLDWPDRDDFTRVVLSCLHLAPFAGIKMHEVDESAPVPQFSVHRRQDLPGVQHPAKSLHRRELDHDQALWELEGGEQLREKVVPQGSIYFPIFNGPLKLAQVFRWILSKVLYSRQKVTGTG